MRDVESSVRRMARGGGVVLGEGGCDADVVAVGVVLLLCDCDDVDEGVGDGDGVPEGVGDDEGGTKEIRRIAELPVSACGKEVCAA